MTTATNPREESWCGRCGRKLTTKKSMDRMLGPTCHKIKEATLMRGESFEYTFNAQSIWRQLVLEELEGK